MLPLLLLQFEHLRQREAFVRNFSYKSRYDIGMLFVPSVALDRAEMHCGGIADAAHRKELG